jgi:molybdate transport system regulatory protein
MESAGRKHHGLGGAERASLPALEKAPADETALRETADMMKGVGARVKELSETLASLGGACEQTAELMERLADVRGRSFAMRHATQKLAGAAGAMQTETERSLLALKSVKLGRTLKEIHALARWEPCRGMTVKHEVSVVRDGRGFGKEAAELLRGIEEIGSLKGAIAGIQMGFGPAWRMLRDIERRLGFPLLERKIGGASGGGSRLTPEARDLMRRYEALSQDVEEALQEIYAKHFG